MSNGRIEIAWGDGDHVFNLAKVGQILELESKCDCGVMEILNRLRQDRWRFNDIRETIRIGLIGGGMAPVAALDLVKRYVDDRPWGESVHTALTILIASIVGVPGDDVGKPDADQTVTQATAASSDPLSTGPAPSLASVHDRSMNAPSGNLQPASMDTTAPTAAMSSRQP